MSSTELSIAIFNEVKKKLNRSLFDDNNNINLCIAGNIDQRYNYDLEINITATDRIDDRDEENNYTVSTYYNISTDCDLVLVDWKSKPVNTPEIESMLEKLITKLIES